MGILSLESGGLATVVAFETTATPEDGFPLEANRLATAT